MLLPRCNPLAMTGTAMGGMAVLAGIGPFLAGVGVGAGIVGGALLVRKAMDRRSGWKDDAETDLADTYPDEGSPMADANPA